MKITPRLVLIAALALASGFAAARDRDGPGFGGRGGPGPDLRGRMVFDSRYHHDHYYPAPGFIAYGLPRGSLSVGFGVDNYFFNSGVWYRPYAYGGGPRYRVILPPVGIVVPLLPSSYVTLRIGGLPYYYANGAYYMAETGGPGYVVVAPPPEAAIAQAAPLPASPPRPDPIVYPRNAQTPAQTEADRQECNRWATSQPSAMNDASVFNRAVEACMDGRGYSMR